MSEKSENRWSRLENGSADSLDIVELVMELEEQFDTKISDENAANAIARYLEQRRTDRRN